MKLAKWRKLTGLTQVQLAQELGCTQPYVSQIERTRNPTVPGRDLMTRIYELTDGSVGPADFFDLPVLARKDAA